MKIVELGGQFQCRLEDGSVVAITTPALTPTKDLTVDDVRDTMMSLGEDAMSKRYKNTGILQAHGGFSGLKLHDE